LIEKIKKQLNFELIKCKFVERDNLIFLDIEINSPVMDDIVKKTKIISSILDEIDENNNYYLNVYSSGIEKNINISDIKNHIQKNIKIFLIKQHLNKTLYEGELIEVGEESIKIKINFKGCFRKIEFQKKNIQKLSESIKIKQKLKKEKNYE